MKGVAVVEVRRHGFSFATVWTGAADTKRPAGVRVTALQFAFKDPMHQSVITDEAAPLALCVEAVIALLPQH